MWWVRIYGDGLLGGMWPGFRGHDAKFFFYRVRNGTCRRIAGYSFYTMMRSR